MGDFLLDYTASEINKKLGEIDNKLETVSWNDLTDKPFYYDEYTVKYILVDFFQESFPYNGFVSYNLYQAKVNEGDLLRVFFDGNSYIIEDATDIYNQNVGVGNTSLIPDGKFKSVERRDTGESFCIVSEGLGSGVYGAHFFTQEKGVHSFKVELLENAPYTKQLDEKFIPDTIARTDDLTILPIERLADFGGSAEIDSWDFVNLCISASMQNPTNYLFKIEINDAPKGLKIRFVNSDGTKHLLNVILKTSSSLLYHITNDTKNKCVTIYELYYSEVYEFFYDGDGNFVSRVMTSNTTSYKVLDQLNSKTKSDSYSPTADTDVATKKYVDDLSQSFILNSSTEGSSKRFQITVDDTGTITAKEITS